MIKFKRLLSCVCAVCVLSGCSSANGSNSSVADTTQQTTAAVVTLPSSSESTADQSSENTNSNAECTPLMWKVTNADGHTVILMGSMHALKDEVYPLPSRIIDAYENADVLAVECDITSVTNNFAVQLALMNEMIYSDSDKLAKHLSEQTYENISGFLTSCGYDMTQYESYKPWAISSVCDQAVLELTGLDGGNGVDRYLLEKAHTDGKKIHEVESVDFQYSMLMNFSDGIYDAILNTYSEENKDKLSSQLVEMYDIWREGNLEKTEEFLSAENASAEVNLTAEQIVEYDDYNDQMLYERNIVMADAVESLLADYDNTFYVVGLAHFMGEGGIIDLLEQRGYTIEEY